MASTSSSASSARRSPSPVGSGSLLDAVTSAQDVMDLLVVNEHAFLRRLDAALEKLAAADVFAELAPIAHRLKEIRDFHRRLVLPKLVGSSAVAFESFFAEQCLEFAAIYRSFLAVEVPASVADLVVQLRPSLRVVDEQLAAYGLLFAALHRVGPCVEVEAASSGLEFTRLGCRRGRRCLKYRGFMRARTVKRHLRSDPPKRRNLGRLYKLRNAWEQITHAQCALDLGMTIPQIMKVKAGCSYVLVGFGWRSLGEDGIGMLRRASTYVTGNPDLSEARRQVSGTLLHLIESTVPTSVKAFRDAVSAEERSTGTDPLDVLVKVLESLKPEDRERFTVLTDRAFVCPHCQRHESTAAASPKTQLFFYCHRSDYNYTQPWADMCGLPFEGFGPTHEMAPPQKGRCKNRGCAEVLRSGRDDGKLVLKEKLRRPARPGTPEKPQYVVLNYRCPPEIDEKVRPFMEQRFGAFRMGPRAKVGPARGPPTVFNTDHQEVFHLVGYGVIVPRVFNHGAWRTHKLETASDFRLRPHRFIHFEADREYYRVGEQDYLSGEQQIALAIYRSTGERSAEQPRDHEDEWERRHTDAARAAEEAPPRMATRSQAAQSIDEPGPSGLQQQQAAAEDARDQAGPSGAQQKARKKTAQSGKSGKQ